MSPWNNVFSCNVPVTQTCSSIKREIFIDGFVPSSTSVVPMFPCFDSSSEWDEYGEVINPDDYVAKLEDMDRPFLHVS